MQIHQQIIDQIAYITIVMFSQYIPQSNSILSPQRVIADKSAFTVFQASFPNLLSPLLHPGTPYKLPESQLRLYFWSLLKRHSVHPDARYASGTKTTKRGIYLYFFPAFVFNIFSMSIKNIESSVILQTFFSMQK